MDLGPKQRLVGNERLKLSATLMNNCAGALFIGGVITPVIATAYGARPGRGDYIFFFIMLWSFAAGLAHLAARTILGRLEP